MASSTLLLNYSLHSFQDCSENYYTIWKMPSGIAHQV